MSAAPIAFRSAPGAYSFLGPAKLVNAFAEQQGNDAKGPLAVLPCEGLASFVTNGTAPCRGMIYLPDLDKLYAIHDSDCYRVTYDGTTATSLRIGTVPGIDIVQLSRNQKADPEVVVQATAGTQIIASDSLSYVLDTDLPTPVISADYVNGYTAYGIADRRYFITSLNSSKLIAALDFATFQRRAGKLIRVQQDNGELIGFCDSWMEFWRDVGNADFTFQPIGFKDRGLKAKNAVVRCDNTLMFPSDDNTIVRLDNYNPTVISTHEISRLIERDATPENMLALSFDRAGHKFASFSGTTWTRCYDARTSVWHSRESYGSTKWRARHAIAAWGKTIVSDSLSGKLFILDKDTFTEDGNPLVWKVISPVLHVFPNGGILDAAHFDLATGYGLLSGQGSDPKIMLRTSTDGGNTFSNYQELSLGVTGNYSVRVTARRLGRFGPKGIVFELSISDPVVRAFVNCDVEIRALKR